MLSIYLISIIISLSFVVFLGGRRAYEKLKLLRLSTDRRELTKLYGAFLYELGYINGGVSFVVIIFSTLLYYNYLDVLSPHVKYLFPLVLIFMLFYSSLFQEYVSSVTSKLKHGRTQELKNVFKSNMINTIVLAIFDLTFLCIIMELSMWLFMITSCIVLIVRALIIVGIYKEKPEGN